MSKKKSSDSNGSPHKQIQAAHESYFQAVSEAWGQAMNGWQAIQIDYERALEAASFSQEPDGLRMANENYQQACQEAGADDSVPARCAEAYREYKLAIQKAIASADIDDLRFTDLAHLSQSLCTVSQTAMGLIPAAGSQAAGALDNPFEQQA